MARLCLDVTFMVFLSVVSSKGQPTANPSCQSRICSWESFTRNHKKVVNNCSMTNVSQNAVYECPNAYGTIDDLVSGVEALSLEFFSIPVEGDKTTMCANITFSLERSGGLSTLQAVRFAAHSSRDEGAIFCQIWTLGSVLDTCSLTEGNCSYDDDMKRVFSNKCFCNITPGQGVLKYSVDVLPKSSNAHQIFQSVTLPECSSEFLKKNQYCSIPEEERWRPVHRRIKQLCLNDNSSGSFEMTFDLAPEHYGFKEYFVFLYVAIDNTCNPEGSYISERIVSRISTSVFEKTFDNQTFNMTTVRFTGLNFVERYIAGVKVKEGPNKGVRYPAHILCDPIQLQPSPCSSNPCSDGQRCVVDCLSYRCECQGESDGKDEECHSPATGMTASSENGKKKKKMSIWFFGGAAALFAVILCVPVAFLALRKIKQISPRVTDHNYEACDGSGIVDPSEVESQNESRSRTKVIWLVCNADWRLQNFADKLRDILQRRVNCKVSLHTVWPTAHAGWSRWVTDEPCSSDRVCFIWDRNLPMFNTGLATKSQSVYQMIETLPESIHRTAVKLHFDFDPLDVTDPRSFKLPSGLATLIEELSGHIVHGDEEILQNPYQDIKNYLQTNICQQSKKVWAVNTDGGDASKKTVEEDDLDYDSSDSQGSSSGDLSLDEEDANVEEFFQVHSSIT